MARRTPKRSSPDNCTTSQSSHPLPRATNTRHPTLDTAAPRLSTRHTPPPLLTNHLPSMEIRSLETFIIPPRWCFLKITTADGIVGWGEPVVEGKAATVAAAVEEMSDFLI